MEVKIGKEDKSLKEFSLIKKDVRFKFLFSVFKENPVLDKKIFEMNIPRNVKRIKVESLDK